MIRSMLTVVLMAGFACFASTAFAKGDPVKGKQEVYSCHGQNEQYIIDALNEYKSGARDFPTMNAQAHSLTEQQIENIAAYLSSLAPKQPHKN